MAEMPYKVTGFRVDGSEKFWRPLQGAIVIIESKAGLSD